MTRRAALLPALALLLALAAPAQAETSLPEPRLPENRHETSQQALELRKAGDLVPYAPPQTVLAALFTTEEKAPKAIYGPVSAYVKTRACPATWLMARTELENLERRAAKKSAPPYEVNLILEEDCKGGVAHAVFVAAPGSTPEAWLRWRTQHGRKAKERSSATLAGLKKAAAEGLVLSAELRALSVDGVPVAKGLEEALKDENRLTPVFDLQTGRRTE